MAEYPAAAVYPPSGWSVVSSGAQDNYTGYGNLLTADSSSIVVAEGKDQREADCMYDHRLWLTAMRSRDGLVGRSVPGTFVVRVAEGGEIGVDDFSDVEPEGRGGDGHVKIRDGVAGAPEVFQGH